MVETPGGYRFLELCEGDITELPEPVDDLVASSYSGSPYQSRDTVLRAIYAKLAVDPAIWRPAASTIFDRPLGCGSRGM